MTRWAVIDFETTGISPGQGDRATEVAIAIVDHGQMLMALQRCAKATMGKLLAQHQRFDAFCRPDSQFQECPQAASTTRCMMVCGATLFQLMGPCSECTILPLPMGSGCSDA